MNETVRGERASAAFSPATAPGPVVPAVCLPAQLPQFHAALAGAGNEYGIHAGGLQTLEEATEECVVDSADKLR
jgi:hypothetical protein